jgi:glycosyltransferase involved in cell wall biosynthesis
VSPVRVAVDARFVPGTRGGVETVVAGLAQGFATLEREQPQALAGLSITFLTYAGLDDWLRPHLGGRVLAARRPAPPTGRPKRVARLLRGRPPALVAALLPRPDPDLRALGADLVHFPFQFAARTAQPFVYHPHDLQHRHLPEFFPRWERLLRDAVYGSLCRRAAVVSVGTTWVRDDVVREFGIPPERVEVVTLAPFSGSAAAPGPVPAGLGLPARYAVYPAVAWPHKNHARLLEALGRLRRRGLDVPLALTGARPGRIDLAALAARHGVGDLVHDLGYLPQGQAEAVLAGAAALVVPTLFEAASFPIWEAFRLGVPVACSDVTALPEQVGPAAVVFDPGDPDAIADALAALWNDPQLAARLVGLGRARVARFSWDATARRFAALYRRIAAAEPAAGDLTRLSTGPVL